MTGSQSLVRAGSTPAPYVPVPPASHRDEGGALEWRPLDVSMFSSDGPAYDDPQQNFCDDCWLAAGEAGVAATDPDAIRRAVGEAYRHDGQLYRQVTLFQGTEALPRPVSMRVPVGTWWDRGRDVPAYMSSTDARSPIGWPGCVETAAAALAGGYEALDAGGSPADALFLLTGRGARQYVIVPGTNWTTVGNQLARAVHAGRPAWVSSYEADAHRRAFGEEHVLIPSHTYVVVDARQDDGELCLKLRNTWGDYRNSVPPAWFQADGPGCETPGDFWVNWSQPVRTDSETGRQANLRAELDGAWLGRGSLRGSLGP